MSYFTQFHVWASLHLCLPNWLLASCIFFVHILSFTLNTLLLEIQEEQKVIEAKIRMRQKELQDDDEREQHHHDDDQDYHPSPLPALLPPPDPVQDSWRTAWESITHPPQVSTLCHYTELDDFVSWFVATKNWELVVYWLSVCLTLPPNCKAEALGLWLPKGPSFS